MTKPKIAIIGAGFSGVVLACELQKIAEIKIFEKSRGCGGRMAARYEKDFAFDHGAQFFTARTQEFQNFLSSFISSQDVLPWQGKVINFEADGKITEKNWSDTHFVATPNMNGLCKKLAQNLDISFGIEVAPLNPKTKDGWHLFDKNNNDLDIFDLVISTAPSKQTINLFSDHVKENLALNKSEMKPCFALMIGFDKSLKLDWIFAEVQNNPIKSIVFNSSKPGRNKNVSCFVVHSQNTWATEHIEDDILQIEQILLQNFSQLTKINCAEASYIKTHLWRYALAETIKKPDIFLDGELRLAATGDWASNSRIEDVWIAAMKTSEEIKLIL